MNDKRNTKWFSTGIALDEKFFEQQPFLDEDDLLVTISSLTAQVGELINKPGTYEFKLGITKVK